MRRSQTRGYRRAAAGADAAKAPADGDDGASFMPGIEAQKAFDLIGGRFPGPDADGLTVTADLCSRPELAATRV